ncbi:DMT family transporter [Cerasicoccus maritimus]|uniref:DMT family transporter n=1 Tax=Cerasicoccus maritimus TaxID=490089 RepID=UPI0028527538|nr:DMT family transporter [Cerasicoccus maritimus]
MHLHYLLPAFAGAVYALSSMFCKRALQEGSGALRLSFVANVCLFLGFAPLTLIPGEPPDWSQLHWPIMAGTGFFIGNFLTFMAIKYGDVSVQAPMMGTKVVFVAAFSVIMGAGPVPLTWWIGAGLTAIAIFLLSFSDWSNRRAILKTAVLALAASAVFGLTDVLVMKHAGGFSPGWFLALVAGVLALESLLLIPCFEGRLRDTPRKAWPWILGGAALMSMQAVSLGSGLAFWGDATALNIIYSSRGLWSIVFVWGIGSLFANREREAGNKVMGRRMAGALMLVAAIALVLI